jgi:arylsulfatase A-like enzyme
MKHEHSSTNSFNRRQLLKYGLYSGLAASLWSNLWLSGCGKRRPDAEKPNIVFILIDTLRADRLGAYGHTGGYTPTLDSIAGESVVFERAIAQSSWTQPSVASLFCSFYPSVHKVLKWQKKTDSNGSAVTKVAVLNDSFVTLAEALQKEGYQTAAFVANPFVVQELGFAQGFEHFDSSFAKNTTPGNLVNEAALAWLSNRNTEKPFFCYLHYMDVHGPYRAREELLKPLLDQVEAQPNKRSLSDKEIKDLKYLYSLPEAGENVEQHKRLSAYREYWEARYDGGVCEVDQHIRELKLQLEKMGLWKEAYVIVTSDHGEELLEHGYWDHGYSLHHTELHVPLFIRWRGVPREGNVVRKTVQLIDLMPTIIEQLGFSKVKGLQGRSLTNEILGEDLGQPTVAFAEGSKGTQQMAVYSSNWKLITSQSVKNTSELQLYDVGNDPLEQNELSRLNSNRTNILTEILQNQSIVNKKLGAKIWAGSVSLTPEQIQRLRSLGYLE